jgi:hypothetical protein
MWHLVGAITNEICSLSWTNNNGGISDLGVVDSVHREYPLMSLAFFAATYNNQTFEVEELPVGTGPATYTTPAGLLLPDNEGVYRSLAAGAAPWHGARWVTNYVLYSEDFTQVNWSGSSADLTHGVDDVNGGTAAVTVTATAPLQTLRQNNIVGGGAQGLSRRQTFWIKRRTGTGDIEYYDGLTYLAVPVTNEWQRVTVETNYTGWFLRIAVSGDAVDVCFAQFEEMSGLTNQNPSEYVPTTTAAVTKLYANENGNTVASNVVTEATGALLDPLPSLYVAPALENLITYSHDLTNAAWAVTGTNVAAYDAVGLTGAPNTASTLTDDDGAAHEDVAEVIAIATTNITHTWKIEVLKDSDVSRFPTFFCQLLNGTENNIRVHFNTSTGATNIISSTGTVAVDVRDAGLWWEVLISIQNTGANPHTKISLLPASGTVFGTESVAATGSIIVGNVGLYSDKSIAEVRGSAPIITAGTAASTVAVNAEWPTANHDNAQGAWYMDWTPFAVSDDLSTQQGFINWTSNSGIFVLSYSSITGVYSIKSGTNASIGSAGIAAGVEQNSGVAYDGAVTSIQQNLNGVYGTEITDYSAFLNSGVSSLRLGSGAPNVDEMVCLFRNIRRYDDAYDDAKTIIDALMLETDGGFPLPAPAAGGNRPDDKNAFLGGPGNTDDLEQTLLGPVHVNDGWLAEAGGVNYNDALLAYYKAGGATSDNIVDAAAQYWAGGGGGPSIVETPVNDGATLYDPLETSPNWELLNGGSSGANHQTNGDYEFENDATNTAVGIVGSAGAIQIKCDFTQHGLTTGESSFELALRVTDEDNYVGIRSYNGELQVFQRDTAVFTNMGSITQPGDATTVLYIDPTTNEVFMNGVSYGITTVPAGGSAGIISRPMSATVIATNYVWGI